MRVNGELERKRNEAAVALFEVLFQHLLEGTEENFDLTVRIFDIPVPRFDMETCRIEERSIIACANLLGARSYT
jgi:hypothetical protein